MVNHQRLVKRKEEAKNNHVNKKNDVIGTWANFLTELSSSLKENTQMFMVTLSQSNSFKQSKKLLITIQDLCYFCSVTPIMSLPFEESAAEEQTHNDCTLFRNPPPSCSVPPFPATGHVSTESLESTERKTRTKKCEDNTDHEGKRNIFGISPNS